MFEVVKLTVGLVILFFVIKTIKTATNKYIAFVVFALWLRFFLSAFHSITFPPLIAGFSINAMGSIGIACLGLIIIPKDFLALRKLIPIYLFFITIVVSALYNAEYAGLIKVLVKWVYFLTVAVAFYLAFKISGITDTCRRALIPFLMPFLLQLFSILFGEFKAAEADGSASYIGGYNHEAAFSMMLVSFVILLSVVPKKTINWHKTLFFTGVFFIYMANYRTAILAVLPVILIFIYSSLNQKITPRYKLLISLFSSVALLGFFLLFFNLQQDRFQDISIFFMTFDELIKAPAYFTLEERRIFSSRVYIWSQYLTAFINADGVNQLLGFGPESWSGIFELYAHNTFVSYLYEYGYLGFVSFLFLNSFLLFHSWKIENKQLSTMVFFSLVGFLIMNLATMPLWNVEGLIVYSILVSLTFANPKFEMRHEQ